MFLDRILKTRTASPRRQAARQNDWRSRAGEAPPVRDFYAALSHGEAPRIIAEIKRASPSRGPLRPDLDPARQARQYHAGGARALSVLTEEDYFLGSLEDLQAARAACPLPVLRKDFLTEPWEVFEARAHGADAVLLIAAVLPTQVLGELMATARDLGMEALVEVHSLEELEAIQPLGPRIVGINNRNLKDFQVSLETTRRLAGYIQRPALKVSESGLGTFEQLSSFPEVDAFLIGESLVTAENPRRALEALRGLSSPEKMQEEQ